MEWATGDGGRSAPHARRRRAIGETEELLRGQWRRQELGRLQEAVERVRTAIARNREQLQALLTVERSRRLVPSEAERVRALRWEAERLHHEIGLLRDRFDHLRETGGSRAK